MKDSIIVTIDNTTTNFQGICPPTEPNILPVYESISTSQLSHEAERGGSQHSTFYRGKLRTLLPDSQGDAFFTNSYCILGKIMENT